MWDNILVVDIGFCEIVVLGNILAIVMCDKRMCSAVSYSTQKFLMVWGGHKPKCLKNCFRRQNPINMDVNIHMDWCWCGCLHEHTGDVIDDEVDSYYNNYFETSVFLSVTMN